MSVAEHDKGLVASMFAIASQLHNERMRAAVLAALRGEEARMEAAPLRQEVLTGREAAEMLGKSRRTVQILAKKGVIAKVKVPKGKVAFGYTRASIEALVRGATA